MNPVKIRNVEIGTGIPKICIPIAAAGREEIFQSAEHIRQLKADIVEWRGDWYEDIFCPGYMEKILLRLREILGDIPLLFTFRTLEEGGEKAIRTDEYVEMNRKAVSSDCIDLIDVELFRGDETVRQVREAAAEHGVYVIASNHDFQATPSKKEIISRLRKMQELGADILKIAVMPQERKDVLTLLEATEEMASEYAQCPLITMSMSGTGVVSRICGEIFGSAVTFGTAGRASAPGQVDADRLRESLLLLHESL